MIVIAKLFLATARKRIGEKCLELGEFDEI